MKINKIKIPTCNLYNRKDEFIGEINEYELLDIRVQIKNEQTFDYYIIFNGEKIRIDKNGNLESYPDGLLDTMTNLYAQLI